MVNPGFFERYATRHARIYHAHPAVGAVSQSPLRVRVGLRFRRITRYLASLRFSRAWLCRVAGRGGYEPPPLHAHVPPCVFRIELPVPGVTPWFSVCIFAAEYRQFGHIDPQPPEQVKLH